MSWQEGGRLCEPHGQAGRAEEAFRPGLENDSPVLYGLGDKLRMAFVFLKVRNEEEDVACKAYRAGPLQTFADFGQTFRNEWEHRGLRGRCLPVPAPASQDRGLRESWGLKQHGGEVYLY